MKDKTYHDFVVYDLLVHLPEVTSRPMMSGWCLYLNKIPFAAIIGNQLYLKAKAEKAEHLKSLGWQQFSYQKSEGKTIRMSYWLVPDDLIDDPEGLVAVINV